MEGSSYYFVVLPKKLRQAKKGIKKRYQKIQKKQQYLKFELIVEQTTVDQSKSWLPHEFIGADMVLEQEGLRFTIHSYQMQEIAAIIVLYKLQCDKFIDQQKSQQNKQQIGNFEYNCNLYIDLYQDGKTKFQQTCQLSNQYSLDYEVFVADSKEKLDNLINDSKDGRKMEYASAFKRGKKKIKCIQYVGNEERSFSVTSNKSQIVALKRDGKKFVAKKVKGKTDNSLSANKSLEKLRTRQKSPQKQQPVPSIKAQKRLTLKDILQNLLLLLFLCTSTYVIYCEMIPTPKTTKIIR